MARSAVTGCLLIGFVALWHTFVGMNERAWALVTASQAAPELPRILSARVVLDTKFGTAVRVSYCFGSLPSDPERRPRWLRLTVDNLKDGLPPLSHPWEVKKRCATVIHPVASLQQPYVLRYETESSRGTRSKQGLIKLKTLPELDRRPELPRIFKARVVSGAEGKALRISYCFRSLPRDRSRRPSILWITIVNAQTDLRQAPETAGGPSRVESRCGSVTYPIPRIEPPYRVLYSVVSVRGTRTGRAQIVVG